MLIDIPGDTGGMKYSGALDRHLWRFPLLRLAFRKNYESLLQYGETAPPPSEYCGNIEELEIWLSAARLAEDIFNNPLLLIRS